MGLPRSERRTRGRQLLPAAACLLLSVALGGCTRPTPPANAGSSDRPSPQPVAAAAVPYQVLLDEIDQQIARATPDAQTAEGQAEAARLFWRRAQLSGDYQDLHAGLERLRASDALATSPAQNCPLRTALLLAVHRVAEAQGALAGCQNPQFSEADRLAYVGEIAYQQGDSTAALTALRASLRQQETLAALTRLAVLHARSGNVSEAQGLLEHTQRLSPSADAQFKAWLHVQRGVLALGKGRPDQARALYELAAAEVAGWWWVEEHIAEVLALEGDTDAAIARYQGLAAKPGLPEHHDALAQLLRQSAHASRANPHIERAAQLHAARMALLPEAAIGHALEHSLHFGSPQQALALARQNLRLRPNSEARLQLAQALYKAGEPRAALAEVERLLASGIDTAQAHAIAAQLAAALGQSDRADRARDAARLRNPRAMRYYPLVAPAQPELAQ